MRAATLTHSISRLPALGAAIVLGIGASCSSSLFQDYPDTAWPGLEGMQAGNFAYAAEQFAQIEGSFGADAFLGRAEAGMAWHVGGELRKAVDEWLIAAETLDSFGDRPTISGRSLTEGTLSLLLNDKTVPYDGEGFEAALLHGFLAWNFLRLGELDGAMVEVKRGYEIEQFEEERYGTTYGMNRFARYVAALAQEFDGRPDEAEIDLNVLEEEDPGHPAVRFALDRVRALQTLEGGRAARSKATLLVVYERGRMPQKVEESVTFQTRRSFGQIALPAFERGSGPANKLRVIVGGRESGTTSVLEDVEKVARQNLSDRIGWITTKELARAAGKTILIDAAAEAADDQHGQWAGLLVGLFGSVPNIATQSADLRSWLTLPRDIQVLRVEVEPGPHMLRLELTNSGGGGNGQPWADLGVVQFEAGHSVLVGARSLGSALHAAPPRVRTAKLRQDKVQP
ncbi:MAG: hypothetical protein O3A20_08820 [Planctomycetota bacterium]|nr:hypothetical protein [Planctomycetota bacterium]